MHAKPHISPAYMHLWRWAKVSGVVLAVCLVLQTLVVGFVHFTDVRRAQVEPKVDEEAPLAVVPATSMLVSAVEGAESGHAAGGRALATAQGAGDVGAAAAGAGGAAGGAGARAAAASGTTPMLRSGWDLRLELTADWTWRAGQLAALVLAVSCLVAALMAGAGQIAGAHQATSAGMWALVMAVVAIAGADRGVGLLVPYAAMIERGIGPGEELGTGLIALRVALPMVAVVLVGLVLWRLREGVAAGLVLTHMSEAERLLEKEMSNIRSAGVGSNFGAKVNQKVVATLNRPVGDPG